MKSKFLLIIFLFVLIPSILLLAHFSFQDKTEPVNMKPIPGYKRCEVDSDCVLGHHWNTCCTGGTCEVDAINNGEVERYKKWWESNCKDPLAMCPLYARCPDDTEYDAKCKNNRCVAQEVPSWNIFR